MMRRWRGRGERGSAGGESLEIVLVAPAVLAVLLLSVAAGRYVDGTGSVDQAAAAAARAASLTATASAAEQAATTQAAASLGQAGMSCTGLTVSVDTSGYTAPRGQAATVSVTVACQVPWADLAIPGLPGQRTVTATAASPLDIQRERS